MAVTFVGYDRNQLMTQIQQYLISKGYWEAGTWNTDTGYIMLQLLADLVATENYSINRAYEEVFEETSRRLDMLVGALHRKGFDFSRVFNEQYRQAQITGWYVHHETNPAVSSTSVLCGKAWNYDMAFRLSFTGYVTYSKTGLPVTTIPGYFTFDSSQDLMSVGRDTIQIVQNVSDVYLNSAFVGEILRTGTADIDIDTQNQISSEYTLPAGQNVILERSFINSLVYYPMAFTTTTRNTVVKLPQVSKIITLIKNGTDPVPVWLNKYQSLTLPRAYLSVAEDGTPTLVVEDFPIGTTFNVVGKLLSGTTDPHYDLTGSEPFTVTFTITHAQLIFNNTGIYVPPSDAEYQVNGATETAPGVWDIPLSQFSLSPTYFEIQLVTQSTIDPDQDLYTLRTNLFAAYPAVGNPPVFTLTNHAAPPFLSGLGWDLNNHYHDPVTAETRTMSYMKDHYLQHKLYGNESLASINDIKRMMNDLPFINNYDVYKVGPLVHIKVDPFIPSVEDVINTHLSGALFAYIIESL
jgi:hypothetical protein